MKEIFLAIVVLCASCAPSHPGPAANPGSPDGSFQVAVFGDMPYPRVDSPEWNAAVGAYRAVLDTIAAREVAFAVHVGDITGHTCTDSLYAERVREFASMRHPLFYTFGDNEWTDCARDGFDQLERLATLRRLFTTGRESLGRRTLPLERQSDRAGYERFSENTRWRVGEVTFVALHVVGSNNNWGKAQAPTAEYVERNAANLAWLRESFAAAKRDQARGIAIFMQANPFGQAQPGRGFADLVRDLQRLATDFAQPVALVHGDTHYFRVDQPLRHPDTGRILTNMTRAETYGNPNPHALLMTVDPGNPNLFRFEPLLVRANLDRKAELPYRASSVN